MSLFNETAIFLSKLPILNCDNILSLEEQQTALVYSKWQSDHVEIKILNETDYNEWFGLLNINDIKTSSKDLEIPFEEIFKECQQALSTIGGRKNFSYLIRDHKFILQKIETHKISYFEIVLLESNENLKDFFISESIDIITSIRDNVQNLEDKLQEKDKEYKELVEAFEKCNKIKASLELDLMSKFVILLNSKKDKITELTNQLKERTQENKQHKESDDEKEIIGSDDKKENDNFKHSGDSDDMFDAPTQKNSSNENTSESIQPKIIHLPKRQKTKIDNRTPKVIISQNRKEIPCCSKDIPMEINEEFNSDEFYKKF